MDGKVHKRNKKSVNHNTLKLTTDEDQNICDCLNCPIVNFPFISSNSTTAPEYIYFTSQNSYVFLELVPGPIIIWTDLSYWYKSHSNKAMLLLSWNHLYTILMTATWTGWRIRNIHFSNDYVYKYLLSSVTDKMAYTLRIPAGFTHAWVFCRVAECSMEFIFLDDWWIFGVSRHFQHLFSVYSFL